MSTQPATVESEGYTITSSDETAEQMIEALTPETPQGDEPREVGGEEKSPLSKAASELGKKGGEAAAAKRAAEAKEAKKEAKEKAEPAEKAADSEEQSAEEKPKTKEGDPRHDPKARMLEATRQLAQERREREAERQRFEQRLAEIERRVTQPAQPQERKPAERARPADDDPEPQEEAFETYAEYTKALGAHTARQEFRKLQQHAANQAKAAAYVNGIDARLKRFEARLEKARETTPDILERTAAVADQLQPLFMLNKGERPGVSHVIAEEVLSAENGPALLLHFADHPEELQRILALRAPPEDIKVEVRLIARGLGAATAGTSPKTHVSKAPPPLRPVSGAPHTAADSEPSENDDYDTHYRKMSALERRSR